MDENGSEKKETPETIYGLIGMAISYTILKQAPGFFWMLCAYTLIAFLIWRIGSKIMPGRAMMPAVASILSIGIGMTISAIVLSSDFYVYIDPIFMIILSAWLLIRPGMIGVVISAVYIIGCIIYGVLTITPGLRLQYFVFNIAVRLISISLLLYGARDMFLGHKKETILEFPDD